MLSLPFRRIIYGLFIALFMITAPLLVLYSAGWRYNFSRQTIVKIGSLSIRPQPTDARVFLDGVEQTGPRTDNTLRIKNILPGQYTVRIERDGYSSWEKQLAVHSSTNTFIDQVVLWKQAQPELLAEVLPNPSVTAPNGKVAAGLDDGKIWLINLLNASVQPLAPSATVQELIGWSPDSTTLLVRLTSGQFALIANDNTNTVTPLTTWFAGSITAAFWSLDESYLLNIRSGNTYYQLNTVTRTARQLVALPTTTTSSYGDEVVVRQNIVYAVRTTATGGTFIERWLLQDAGAPKGPERVFQLPGNGEYRFFASANGTIIAAARDAQKILVTDPGFKQALFQGDAREFQWSSDGRRLLVYTDFEVGFYHPAIGQAELVTRYGTPLDRVTLFPQADYLAIATNNELLTLELDNRDHRTSTTLLAAESITDFWLTEDGTTALVAGIIDGQGGVYRLPLQQR